MNEISNTENIIQFDKNAYVRITKTQFEFHSGVVNNNEFIVPIENIRRVHFKNGKLSYGNLGCNIFIIIFHFLIGPANNNIEPSDVQLMDETAEYENAILTLRYKSKKRIRWVSRDISWTGLTKEKANKIIRILKMRNKNLP